MQAIDDQRTVSVGDNPLMGVDMRAFQLQLHVVGRRSLDSFAPHIDAILFRLEADDAAYNVAFFEAPQKVVLMEINAAFAEFQSGDMFFLRVYDVRIYAVARRPAACSQNLVARSRAVFSR